MTPEAQRIQIATACGWKDIKQTGSIYRYEGRNPSTFVIQRIPNYLEDLNAMHEAEKVLEAQDRIEDYWKELWLVVKPVGSVLINAAAIKYLVSATAAQRAEAFLRTLNLYTA
jgi:hypothetical protein